VRDVYGREL